MVALEGRWEEKKKEDCFQVVYIPKRVVEVPFYLSFSFLGFFWGFWFFTVALLAWRVVLFLVGVGLGWGWGSLYNMGESFALDWTTLQVHVTFSY